MPVDNDKLAGNRPLSRGKPFPLRNSPLGNEGSSPDDTRFISTFYMKGASISATLSIRSLRSQGRLYVVPPPRIDIDTLTPQELRRYQASAGYRF